MSQTAKKFLKLKTSIGGNREKTTFEMTFGRPIEEKLNITRPNRTTSRVMSELEFVMHLSEENAGIYDGIVNEAIDYLLNCIEEQGVLTNQACDAAEEMLMPAAEAAKEYKLILAAHAHIDMNWMWSFDETVATTLATFRTMLNLMNEYPDFCFSQSQASVYKIVEEYDPAMMEEIKARIAEGRWEVTASAWVETDKNMPSGESLLRHIECSKEYLRDVWGVKRLDIDFSPDTFGHSANIPEINTYGDVKYYYHCRGNDTLETLYRYRALSGKEVLVHREYYWYNSGIVPEIGINAIKISKQSSGLKTGLIVYGVGDHGGGPSRRDIERALEMMSWKIFPQIKFGTMHEFFDEAMSVWDKLPVMTEELNYIFQGCYSTQSRIKRGNRRLEATLADAEHLTSLAGNLVNFPYAKKQMTGAWQNVLFTHFHDILTGSCVQDSREYAMSLYQKSNAVAHTQIQNAMSSIALNIDTSSIETDIDAYNSQSEGAGMGLGIKNFIGVPSTERGSGRTRIFHVFNTLPVDRTGTVDLTVWDWTGDFKRIQMKDFNGNPIKFQLLDHENREDSGWAHQYFRIIAEVNVPAMGYTTIVLSEADMEQYPVYRCELTQLSNIYNDHILENEFIKVRIDSHSGRIASMIDKMTGAEMITGGIGAGFTYVETEVTPDSSWQIGRHMKDIPVDRCIKLSRVAAGDLRQSVKAVYDINGSKLNVTYSLDKGASAVKMAVEVDWREHGNDKDMIPLLDYRIPVAYETEEYMYDIPAGFIKRKDVHNDVPGLKFGMALNKETDSNVVLISDSKYGYRGADNKLGLTLINTAHCPDPYPESGMHDITLWVGVCSANEKKAEDMAVTFNHNLFYQPSNTHTGTLPMENSLLKAESDNVVVSAIVPGEDGSILVRGYETAGQAGEITVTFASDIEKADAVKLSGAAAADKVTVTGNQVTLSVEPNAIAAVKVCLK